MPRRPKIDPTTAPPAGALPAGIEWRGPYQYRARFRRRGQPGQTSTHESLDAAERWLRELNETAARGEAVADRGEAMRTTLAEALDLYDAAETDRKRGARQERQRISQWKSDPLAARFVGAVRVHDLQRWVDQQEAAAKAPTTIGNALNVLSQTFKWLAARPGFEGLGNPVRGLRRPRSRAGRSAYFSPGSETETALLAACAANEGTSRAACERALWLPIAVKLALATGMRAGEIRRIEWQHIHADHIHLPVTKNDSSRDVPLSPEGIAVVEEARTTLPRRLDGRLFDLTGDQLTSAFVAAVKRAQKTALEVQKTFPNLTYHDLRHVAVTRLAARLGNVLELSAVTGHRSLGVLKRYYNPTPSDLAAKLK
jgi:integrase